MKNNIIISVLLLIIGALAINSIYQWIYNSKSEKIEKEIYSPKKDTIKVIYNHDSTIIKYIPHVGQIPENNITKNYRTYVYDTLAPALRIATEKIAELQGIKAKLEGTIKSQRTEIDKEKSKVIYFQDKYFTAIAKTDTLGNSTLDYKYNAQLDIITETQKRFFAKDVQKISITSPDKNFKINGVEHFKKELILPVKRFGIGIQAGYYYVPETGQTVPAFGLGASYNLLRF